VSSHLSRHVLVSDISHVSKVLRTHVTSSFGTMLANDGKLLMRYCRGDSSGADLGKGFFKETMGQGGDTLGWIFGASVAATFLCGPFGGAALAFAGSTLGCMAGQSIAGLFTDS